MTMNSKRFMLGSVVALLVSALTGCSQSSLLQGRSSNGSSGGQNQVVAANQTVNNGTGSSNNGAANGSSANDNAPNERSTAVQFTANVAKVIEGIPAKPAQMKQRIDATITGQQFGKGLRTVLFTSAQTGFLAGQGIILKTTNGGKTFASVFRGNFDVSGLKQVRGHAEDIVAWGGSNVYLTLDGGAQWTRSSLSIDNQTVHSVDFPTPTEGFAVVGNDYRFGSVWRTTDGGRHWARLSTPSQAASLSFGSQQVGWLGGANGVIYETTNAGTSWTTVFHPHVSTPGIPEVQAVDGTSCWAMMIGDSGMSQTSYAVFRTSDGQHWKPVLGIDTAGAGPAPDNAADVPKGPGSSPGPMVALTSEQAVVTGVCRACGMGSGQVSTTQNGGQTWHTQPTIQNSMSAPVSVSFVSLSEGWVLDSVMNEGTFLLHTADGGQHWQEVYPMQQPHPVEGVSFLNARVGYGLGVPGDANRIVKTSNGGKDWSTVGELPAVAPQQPITLGYSPIDFVTETKGYAIGPDGLVYETTDGGQSWTKSNMAALQNPFDSILFVRGGEVGVVTTYNQEAAVTVNGGQTWHTVELPQSMRANANAELYLSGLANLPVRSSLKTMVGSEDASWVGVKGADLAFLLAQNNRGYFITANGGSEWQNVDFGSHFPGAVSIDFVDSSNGWMITLSGALLRTTDGGRTWVHASHPSA